MSRSCAVKRCSAEVFSNQLCNRHNKQAQKYKLDYGVSMNQGVTAVVNIENKKGEKLPDRDSDELTINNSEEMKSYYQAKKYKEDGLKKEMDRLVQQDVLGFKSEMNQSTLEVLKPILERLVALMDDLPKALAMKSEAQVREVLSSETKIFMKGGLSMLEELEALADEEEAEEAERWKELGAANE